MPGPAGRPDHAYRPANDPLVGRVSDVLELIRPAVQQDGGDIELAGVTTDGTVRIRFLGACVGCPSSEITLREGIARNLRERIPEVTEVEAIN
jgi:Fe-S cluster biogenesis protein NfuA